MKNIKTLFVSIICLTLCFFGGAFLAGCQTPCQHQWDEGRVITPSNCISLGVKEFTCTLCSETKTEEISLSGHTGGEATCTQLAICTVCLEPYGVLDGTNHSGGTATCEELAICDDCNNPYGEINLNNHTGDTVWTKTQTTHKKYYECCDTIVVTEDSHTWENGVCSVCQYSCIHTGGTANCHEKAVCTNCGAQYGEFAADSHTQNAEFVKTENTHQLVYNCCSTPAGDPQNHNFEEGVCVDCTYTCSHSGGTATCSHKAVCENCGAQYGEINADNHTEEINWSYDQTGHTGQYFCCATIVINGEPHDLDSNAHCDICGYTCSHSGGTATCQSKAECDLCGYEYGEINSEVHTGTIEWTKTRTTHKGVYDCCSLDAVAEESHEFSDEDATCTECGYTCTDHTGGEATCKIGARCENCNFIYTEKNPDNHTKSLSWSSSWKVHSRYYKCCNKYVIQNEPHVYNTHYYGCVCGINCPHDGEKTWTQTETTHTQTCNECTKILIEETNHTFTDGECDTCEYQCPHTSTEGATCLISKVCTNCELRVYASHQIVPSNCWAGETCSVEGCTYANGSANPHSYGDDDECEHCGYINNGLLYEKSFFDWKGVRYTGYRVYDIGTCTDTNIRISPVYNGEPVISIRWGAFNTLSGTNYAANPKVANGGNFTVTIPSSVMEIGTGAFANANKLTNIYFEEGSQLVQISGEAFRRCTSLQWIVFPATLKQVGAKAFASNPNLEAFYYEREGYVIVSSDNDSHNYNKIYYYMPQEPIYTGPVWYYDENRIPTKWFDN